MTDLFADNFFAFREGQILRSKNDHAFRVIVMERIMSNGRGSDFKYIIKSLKEPDRKLPPWSASDLEEAFEPNVYGGFHYLWQEVNK